MKLQSAVLAAGLALAPLSHAESSSTTPTPQGKLYVTAWFGGVVDIIDAETRKVQRSVPVGVQDHNVFLSPDQSKAWVTNNNDGTVSVIDTSTDEVVDTIKVATAPEGIAFKRP
jgi:YVTN family beta-propeller protein